MESAETGWAERAETLEILADRELTNRLLELKKSGLSKAKLYTMAEVFGPVDHQTFRKTL